MSKVYPDLNLASTSTDSFLTWGQRINNLVDTLATETVTANSSPTGAVTVGNGYVSGIFGGLTLVTNTIQGGTISVPTVLSIGSNVNYNPGCSFFNGNVTINSLGWFVGVCSANNTEIQVGNSQINVQINSATINVGSNLYINSTNIFVGNSTLFFTSNSSNATVANTVTGTYITPAQIYIGNSQSNALINSTFAQFPALLFGGVGQNTTINALGMFVANTLATANYGATGLVTGVSTVNNIAITVNDNINKLVVNSSSIYINSGLANFTTGDAKITLKNTADPGWILMDDGTIGDASSSATTRANADTSALFQLLWNNINNTYAPVVGGRGSSATADFNAHKKITLTKQLGRALAIGGSGSGLTSRSLGQTLGEETHTMTGSELYAHTHNMNDPSHAHSVSDPTHTHSVYNPYNNIDYFLSAQPVDFGTAFYAQQADGGYIPANSRSWFADANYTGIGIFGAFTGVTTQSSGLSTPFNVMQPTSFWNVMIKL